MLPEPAVESPRFRVVAAGWEIVPVKPLAFRERPRDELERVTVEAPELTSRPTSLAAVGTEAPLAPPEEVDQLAVVEPSQVAEPPTQKRAVVVILVLPETLPSRVPVNGEAVPEAVMSLKSL